MFLAGLITAAVVIFVLAALDVFWPFSVALAAMAIAAWWLDHWQEVIALLRPEWVGLYFILGFVWVFFKWTRVVERAWRHNRRAGPPRWADHRYAFAAYFFYWPIDAAVYVFSDLVRDAWVHISKMVAASFDRYAAWRFQEHRND